MSSVKLNKMLDNYTYSKEETITSFKKESGGATGIEGEIIIKTNSDGSIASFAGNVGMSQTGAPGNISFNTSLRPNSEITLKGNVLRIVSSNTSTVLNVLSHKMTISTSGKVTIAYTFVTSNTNNCRFSFIPIPMEIK